MHSWRDVHLTSERLEECSGAHNAVSDAFCRLQRLLKLEFGVLELQQRLLHADGTEQHKVGGACLLGNLQSVQSGLVVNCPGVFLQAHTHSELDV